MCVEHFRRPLPPNHEALSLPGDQHEHCEVDRDEHAEGVGIVNIDFRSARVRRAADQRHQSQSGRVCHKNLNCVGKSTRRGQLNTCHGIGEVWVAAAGVSKLH